MLLNRILVVGNATCFHLTQKNPMTLTLLLDLDDTLLTNDMQIFQEAYLNALGKQFARFVDPVLMIKQMLLATQKMMNNRLPDRTLKDVFDAAFYPAIKIKREDLQPDIDAFYTSVFPTLRRLTSEKDDAKELITLAQEKGWHIVIATNPIFPKTAIVQRLEWAGFTPSQYHFDLVPSYETFHFAKPNPAFFSEALSNIGWPSEPVMMVGNDFEMDIRPAQKLGLYTFWTGSTSNHLSQTENDHLLRQGSLQELMQWISHDKLSPIRSEKLDPDALLAIMSSTPASLASLIRNIPESELTIRTTPSEWCLTEILCHLRDVDRDVNLPRIKQLIKEDRPFLPGVETDPWAEERKYWLQDGKQALNEFLDVRMEILKLLQNLSPVDWNRIARHAIFGPTSLAELVSFMVTHDQNHIGQWHKVSLGLKTARNG
jgi:FMN phosphatase YigB (HAD superfamily)